MANIDNDTPHGDDDRNMPDGVVRDPVRADDPMGEPWTEDAEPDFEERSSDRDSEAEVVGGRGISPVGAKPGSNKAKAVMGVAAIAGLGALAMVSMFSGGDGKAKPDKEPAGPARAVVEFEPPKNAPPPPPTLGGDAEAAILTGDPRSGAGPTGEKREEIDPRVARLEASQRSEILAYSSGGRGGLRAAVGGGQGETGGGSSGNLLDAVFGERSGPRERNELERMRETSTIGRSRARMLPNRNYLLTAGTQIPCILQTAMDTGTPGFVSCLVSRDVYSDNGNTVLMEKGTRVLGEYRGGLKRGQNRMFVVWNRAVTPNGVAVDLASPAADALGRAGMSGDVETFFWQRFGGAMLISLVDDAVAIAGSRYDEARNSVRQPSDAAGIALENSINIPPVLRKAQGEQVSIFAAEDFDFSGVYTLTLR